MCATAGAAEEAREAAAPAGATDDIQWRAECVADHVYAVYTIDNRCYNWIWGAG